MQEYAEKSPKADSCGCKFTATEYWNYVLPIWANSLRGTPG
jgi:hypothetical protein